VHLLFCASMGSTLKAPAAPCGLRRFCAAIPSQGPPSRPHLRLPIAGKGRPQQLRNPPLPGGVWLEVGDGGSQHKRSQSCTTTTPELFLLPPRPPCPPLSAIGVMAPNPLLQSARTPYAPHWDPCSLPLGGTAKGLGVLGPPAASAPLPHLVPSLHPGQGELAGAVDIFSRQCQTDPM
jgi:hypothetical protein